MPPFLMCQDSNDIVSVDQFEKVEREYLKLDKESNELKKAFTNLTERVTKQITFADLYKKLWSVKNSYTKHKYQVYNDTYQWPLILATVEEYGEIWYSDFSENMSQLNKYEVQSAHFNKRAYSLHCTVEHVSQLKYPDLKSPYRYHYH